MVVEFWPVDEPTDAVWAAATPDARQKAKARAISLLWERTAQVFGLVEQVVRPCTDPRAVSSYRGGSGIPSGMAWTPGMMLGNIGAAGPCGCGSPNCYVGAHETPLPGPVNRVLEVKIADQVLPPAAYRVRNSRWLLRIDGQAWPTQNLNAPEGADGTWVVRYVRGLPVPAAGQAAAGALASYLLKRAHDRATAACGGLPERVKQVTRQGVSAELVDEQGLFENGATGIEVVDQWLAVVNPDGRRQASRVINPQRRDAVQLR
ncbi:hypothetical protein FK268_12595 [Tsukamurella sputi]|uniref:Head-to-tail adaptor n=1 Tax=Tsukamurella sputi TaxID=2591848 RepID=A0A5C5RQI8_9ACTN|nr:hypothetical protein [Tsukamurella sputi]TWS24421.1 hypothetical protein FK268_12595 [Tsukamurella sputi]